MFFSFSVLLIINPVAFVLGTVGMRVLAEPVCFVILPVAVVDVAVRVYQPSTPIGLIVLPIPFINASVAPNLIASSMPLFCLRVPFSFILSTVRKRDHVLLLSQNAWIVVFVGIKTVYELW